MSRRYERASTVLTSNKSFADRPAPPSRPHRQDPRQQLPDESHTELAAALQLDLAPEFQSTPPCGGATSVCTAQVLFQFTLPREE
jgi:hypothetical protein